MLSKQSGKLFRLQDTVSCEGIGPPKKETITPGANSEGKRMSERASENIVGECLVTVNRVGNSHSFPCANAVQ
jgi:hypothetical protein